MMQVKASVAKDHLYQAVLMRHHGKVVMDIMKALNKSGIHLNFLLSCAATFSLTA
jgi:hypothetical protein